MDPFKDPRDVYIMARQCVVKKTTKAMELYRWFVHYRRFGEAQERTGYIGWRGHEDRAEQAEGQASQARAREADPKDTGAAQQIMQPLQAPSKLISLLVLSLVHFCNSISQILKNAPANYLACLEL